jgi:hypothetical protein
MLSASGSPLSIAGGTFTLVSVAGVALTATWSGSGLCVGSACSMELQAGEVLALNTGAHASLLGDNIEANGVGSFAGTVETVGGLPA